MVLYRKYRPQKFSEITGQEHIVQTLTNAIVLKMISHAYLFSGPRGSGKTSLARLLAKSINCYNRKEKDYEPCNKCSSCLEINQGSSLDLIEIDAASNRGIDEIRELKEGIKFSPVKSKYRVFILDEAHQLSKDASNALLKTLEEPPSHAIFILATTEIHKMISTIISRCQRFDFKKLKIEEIKNKLELICQKERIKIEKEALEAISLNAQGSLRDAINMLDQAITFCTNQSDKEITIQEVREILGLVGIKVIKEFVDYLKNKNVKSAINYLNEIYEKGIDLENFSRSLINYLRELLVLSITKNLNYGFQEQELQKIIKIFLQAQQQIKYSPIPQLPLELAIIESLQFK